MFELLLLGGHLTYMKSDQESLPVPEGVPHPPVLSLFDILPVNPPQRFGVRYKNYLNGPG